MWTFEGIAESILITLFSIYIFSSESASSGGYSSDLWTVSLTMYAYMDADLHQ